MDAGKENWYRTGAAAKQLGTSSHKIRELARAGVIESLMRNGYRYIPAREIDRLRTEGLPPTPANPSLEDQNDGVATRPDSPPRPARSHLTQELYSEPSRQLARSKERVLELGHELEAKRIQQQSRAIDIAAQEEQASARHAQRVQDWRDAYKRRAVQMVPAEALADVCARIDELASRVPPLSDVTAKVDEIIEAALRPVRRREEQAKALQVHKERVAQAVRLIRLPYGATSDEKDEARELASAALLETVLLDATERQFRSALDKAIQPVVERVNSRNAEEERKRREANHKHLIEITVALCAPSGATQSECAQAKRCVRAALERLPATATQMEVNDASNNAVAPIVAVIGKRNEAERLLVPQVNARVNSLERRGTLTFKDYFDRNCLCNRLTDRIRPMVVERVTSDSGLSENDIRLLIDEFVDKYYAEFCE